MALPNEQQKLVKLKQEAESLFEKVDTAPTKDEALKLAIDAAECLIEAIKLVKRDPEQKKEIRAKFTAINEFANRIKLAKSWPPTAPATIAAKIPERAPLIVTQLDLAELTIESPPSVVSTAKSIFTQPSTTTARVPDEAALPVELLPARSEEIGQWATAVAKSTEQPPKSLVETTFPAEPENLATSTFSESLLPDQASVISSVLPAVSQHASSRIRRLPEPLSTRKRTRAEEIILLKASYVNKFKFPPWEKLPASDEFAIGDMPFTDTRELSLSIYQQQFFEEWTRAKDAMPPPTIAEGGQHHASGPIMSTQHDLDLVQDAATDCSVVASLCSAIARAKRGHEDILSNRIYPFDKRLGCPMISRNGKYIIRLNFNGCWRKVIIDDRLPRSKNNRLLHVIDRREPALLWPALIEKAYLKVRGGYDFPGSNSCSDLWTLTGWIPEQIHLQEDDNAPIQLWNRIYNGFNYGDVLVTLGTGTMSSKQERELGLESQHSYAVLDMIDSGSDKLMRVKNPWVEGRGWRGPRLHIDRNQALASLNHDLEAGQTVETEHRDQVSSEDQPYPTTFWISFDHVLRHFESLYLNWNPGLFKHRQDVHFEWSLDGSPKNARKIVENPQFSFRCEKVGNVWLLLTRHFRDTEDDKVASDAFNDGSISSDAQINSKGEASMGYMGLYVCDGCGDRIHVKETYLESSNLVTTPQCLLVWKNDADSTFTLVVDQDELPISLYSFTLSTFSDSAITLELARERYAYRKTVAGEWTRQTAGGTPTSSRYFLNPQYTVVVKEKSSLSILLSSNDVKNALHVKMTLGHGKRVYRLQNRDILCDSGNHHPQAVAAEVTDLQPGLYTIICSLFEAGKTSEYTLQVDSSSEIVLRSIPRDGAGLLLKTLNPACFGPEVHKLAAPIMLQRLASYTFVARFIRATTPRAEGLLPLARSPFRFSVELGRGPERKFVIASERGEYADSAMVRSEAVSIDPVICQGMDLWLVLDRLSGPGRPVEEWYEMEVYMDVPHACSIGVWRDWGD